ncbi:MAG: MOSC domain-containing protein [Gemmatimonadota bacterium]|nr:MAG: MOSC domain-containing protein [Gemmatimonadota bacterium]
MDPVNVARAVTGKGLWDNADFGAERQVTLVEREVFESLPHHIRNAIDPSARRANIMISGIRLANTTDRILRIGPCRILIKGETKPCHRLDEACPGLQEALKPGWGGGAWGDVLDDGDIRTGDEVSWTD